MSLSAQENTLHPDTPQYLQEMLNNVRANILINYQNGIDERDALLLEDFFKITAFGQGIDNPIAGIGLQERMNVLQQYGIPIGTMLGNSISSFAFEDWIQNTIAWEGRTDQYHQAHTNGTRDEGGKCGVGRPVARSFGKKTEKRKLCSS